MGVCSTAVREFPENSACPKGMLLLLHELLSQPALPGEHPPVSKWCLTVLCFPAQALAKNLRIPQAVRGSREGAGDGVFLRLMALPKGRGMLTRALRLLYAPPSLAESVPGECLCLLPSIQIYRRPAPSIPE